MGEVHEAGEADPAGVAGRTRADPNEFGVVSLFALAAGGVIGSGWLLGGSQAAKVAGSWAWVSWLLGGVLMLVVALVMVELGRHAPENGGLIFWPFQSSGPLVALIVAAALWIFYAINPATEAAAVVQAFGLPALYHYGPSPRPTFLGIIVSGVVMLPIAAMNLFGLRAIRRSTVVLTAFKILVPVTVILLLIISGFGHHATGPMPSNEPNVVYAVVDAVTAGGVIYAYVGFQGPLDFAGQVTRRRTGRRMSEAARLRIAVLGTVFGSIVLYTLLQVVYVAPPGWSPGDPESPYTILATQIGLGGAFFAWLIRIDTVASPAGAGVVFVLLLSREVESLSQVRLTDGRLAQPRRLGRGKRAGLWLILVVNVVVGWIGLVALGADWQTMVPAMEVLTLLVYAMPAVSLMAFRRHYAGTADKRFRIAGYWWILAWLSFVGVTEVLYWARWQVLWHGMVLLLGGAVLLLVLPPLSHRIERFRLYDAEHHASGLWSRRKDADVQGAAGFVVFLGALLILNWLGTFSDPMTKESVGSPAAAILGTVAFAWLYASSVRFMREREPVLLLRPSEPAVSSA